MNVPVYVFDDVCPRKRRSSSDGACKTATGYPPELLAFVYNKYQEKLPVVRGWYDWAGDHDGNKWTKKVVHFAFIFMFVHLNPTSGQIPTILRANGQDIGISSSIFYDAIVPMALALACAMNEIHYEDRLDAMNHHPFFPVGFTAIIDTFPVYVSAPTDKRLGRMLYQPKCAALHRRS